MGYPVGVPRKVEWIQQLPEAIEKLQHFPAPVVDRAALEIVLRIQRRVAIRLMHRFGGFQAGKTFLIDRLALIEQLQLLAKGDEAGREQVRRCRLEERLESARRLAPGRKVRIEVAPDVRERVFRDLPKGIDLRPGELRITFVDPEDLLRQLFELSQALANDFEGFRAAVVE